MAEGSMSRNKRWRYMHVLHFFHSFVKAFVGWTEYIKEKQVTWRHETFTPDAKTRLEQAEVGAIYRQAQQTGSSKIFGVRATDGKLTFMVFNILLHCTSRQYTHHQVPIESTWWTSTNVLVHVVNGNTFGPLVRKLLRVESLMSLSNPTGGTS